VLPLQNRALALLDLAGLRARVQNRTDSLVKDALQVSLGQGRALKVLVGADFLGANKRLLVRHRLHALLAQGLESSGVLTEIELGADKDDGNVGGVMFDLGMPLCLDVVERRRADDGKADQEDIGLGVRKRAKSVIIFLAGRIPKTETDRLAIDHNAGRVVVKAARRNVSHGRTARWKWMRSEGDGYGEPGNSAKARSAVRVKR
jgi:hypothetical protein